MSIGQEIVNMVKGVTPYLVYALFAFCVVFCVIEGIDMPEWFIAMLGTGTGAGVTGTIMRKRQ